MIVSYHPLIEADKNRICAGRKPDGEDLAAIKAARAVILGQGCYRSLYEMARAHCPHVFPNYDARFKYPGKTGQIRLFRTFKAPHPPTEIYADLASFHKKYGDKSGRRPTRYPLVFKYDWGGEGETVYRLDRSEDLQKVLTQTAEFEKSVIKLCKICAHRFTKWKLYFFRQLKMMTIFSNASVCCQCF